MQKKTIDHNTGVDDYNKKLFTKSIELISSVKKVKQADLNANRN